jgi:nicotinamide-nucleotide amidase
MDETLLFLSTMLGKNLVNQGLTISCAESCTGGLLSHVITAISGSSAYFMGGVVAYSNAAKEALLDVHPMTLQEYGAVSEKTACEMAAGVRKRFGTDLGISTTGIAGPTGGTPEKPVGLVWMGISGRERTFAFSGNFDGDRLAVMDSTVTEILMRLLAEST